MIYGYKKKVCWLNNKVIKSGLPFPNLLFCNCCIQKKENKMHILFSMT